MADVDAAEAAHVRAGAFIRERRFREAIEPAAEACRLRPDWSDAWWNHGVALKHARRWIDWTESVVLLCAKCSLGEPHEHDEDRPASAWRPSRQLGLALRNEKELDRLRHLDLG